MLPPVFTFLVGGLFFVRGVYCRWPVLRFCLEVVFCFGALNFCSCEVLVGSFCWWQVFMLLHVIIFIIAGLYFLFIEFVHGGRLYVVDGGRFMMFHGGCFFVVN